MNNRNVLKYAVLILSTAIAFSLAWHFLCSEPEKNTERFVHAMVEEIKNALNTTPKVTINNSIVIEQASPIAELATAEMPVNIDSTFTSKWLYSTKVIRLNGTYLAKAGFDLNHGFQINVEQKPKRVVVMLPPPKILSCELKSEHITDQRGGLINWLYPQDHQAALEQMTREAIELAKNKDLLNKSKEEIEKRIKSIAALNNVEVVFQYKDQQLNHE